MKTILVSGASGIVGYGTLRSLRNSGKDLLLIGTTIYEDSVAQGFCDIFEKALPTIHKDYIGWLKGVINKHNVDLIIPGIEADLYKWNSSIEEIESTGVKVLTNNSKLIELCQDKWNFYLELTKFGGRYIIKTFLDNDYDTIVKNFGLPFLLKPRRGFASKGIVKVLNREIFGIHSEKIGNELMVQEIVGNDDEEYTTSAFCDGNGAYFCHMTLKRKLSNDGYTDRAETVRLAKIEEALNHLCQFFKPIGPTNFQFRMHNGQLKLLEINPRISSSTSIRAAFGYNEAAMVIDYYLNNQMPKPPILRAGKAIRFIDDKIFYDDRNNI